MTCYQSRFSREKEPIGDIHIYSYVFNNSNFFRVGFPGSASGKEPTSQCRSQKRHRYNPWVWKTPWKRKWQPTPVFLPGKFHRQKSLADYGPWGHSQIWLKWLRMDRQNFVIIDPKSTSPHSLLLFVLKCSIFTFLFKQSANFWLAKIIIVNKYQVYIYFLIPILKL